MEAYKVAGGVAAGVGVVAALPVLGAIGSVSLLGAILGGTVGGIAGAVASEMEEDAQCTTRQSSAQENEESGEPTLWLLALSELREKTGNEKSFGDLVLVLHAMSRCASQRRSGVSLLNLFGWEREVRESIDALDLPESVREEINRLSATWVKMATVAAQVLALGSDNRSHLAELLKPSVLGEDSNGASLFNGEEGSNEVLELVKSLLGTENSGNGE